MTARRIAGLVVLLTSVMLAFAILATLGRSLSAQAGTTTQCGPVSCPPVAAKSPHPTNTGPPTGSPSGSLEATPTVLPPTPVPTDAPSMSPDGVGVAGGVAGVVDTPHGLISVPQAPAVAVAHTTGDMNIAVVLIVALGVVAVTAVTLSIALH
jgi:hypothetical protein